MENDDKRDFAAPQQNVLKLMENLLTAMNHKRARVIEKLVTPWKRLMRRYLEFGLA